MDVTQMVNAAVPTGYASLQRGYISGGQTHPKAAPTAFTEGVWVILPEGSTEHLYGPCKWPAIHGTSKPQAGAVCVVGFDELNHPVVVWWEGPQAEPVPGAESITEAMLKAEAVSEAKLTAAVVAKLNPGVWTAPEAPSAKLEEMGVQVRKEQGSTSVRFKGFCRAKEAVAAETALFTLPAGFRPPVTTRLAAVDLQTAAVILAYVNTTGVVENHTAITITHFWSFDGCTFNLT